MYELMTHYVLFHISLWFAGKNERSKAKSRPAFVLSFVKDFLLLYFWLNKELVKRFVKRPTVVLEVKRKQHKCEAY